MTSSLHSEFQAVTGGRPADELVMQCGSGVTACHHLLALAHAGLTPQVPDGLSWRPGKGFHIGSDVSVNYFLSATRTA